MRLDLQGGPFSRYTKELSLSIKENDRYGLDMLDIRPDLSDSRKYSYSLNSKGKRFFEEFLSVIVA